MIDFNPNTQEAFLTPDLAMKFLVWAVYYNKLELGPERSFSSYGIFGKEDADRLDRIKEALYKCFGAQSVENASAQMRKAKELGEQCPFTRESLDEIFM